jgi:hypothetical protein
VVLRDAQPVVVIRAISLPLGRATIRSRRRLQQWIRNNVLRRPTRNQMLRIRLMGPLSGLVSCLAIMFPIAGIDAIVAGQSTPATWLRLPASPLLFLVFNFLVLRQADEPIRSLWRWHD